LTPDLLFCLFGATPDLVVIEEPHSMARLGVRRNAVGASWVALRDPAGRVIGGAAPTSVTVPMRGDPADGVVDVVALAQALGSAIAALPPTQRPPDPSGSPAALALQLLVAPTRQRYARGAPA
jgi:hypothetical protein